MSTLQAAHQVRVYYRFEEIEDDVPDTIELTPISPKVESIFALDQAAAETQIPKPTKVDWTFGVVMPLVCFYFDPFIFRNWSGGGEGLLSMYQLPVYAVAGVSVMTMVAWLLWGEKLGSLRLPAAFVMLVGAVMSSVLAAVLFPFSMVGLLVIIGVLGFTPGFTAFVFWRNAFRVLRSFRRTAEKKHVS